MKKRIFFSMLLLTSISLVLISTALCFVFYRQFSSAITETLRNRAGTFIDNSSQTAIEALAITESSDMRVTVVAPDGAVVFDNAARADEMPNHIDREEIRDALEIGFGQSKRFSDTLGKETVYCAVRLADGYVLRVAKTSSSIWGVFYGTLPVVAGLVSVMVIIGYILTAGLTKKIIAPINSVNLETELTAPYDEFIPFIKTIAQQRERMAQQLTDLQNRSDTISAIMDNMNEGIILTNKKGIILSANRSVLRIFEKDSPIDGGDRIDGKNILELLRDVEFSGHVNDALNGISGEMAIERRGVSYRVYFSHVGGGGAIILFLDISESVKAEKLRREFSANVSHELKTPLTSIYGNAEMLCNGIVKDGDRQAFYARIKDEAGRLIALIEDILLISRLDEGCGPELFEQVNVFSVASEAAESLAQKAVENKINLELSGESTYVYANRSMIYEMFSNLIDNAIKYNIPGGSVNVSIAKTGGKINITVTDTGIGIPEEAQLRVFERFYRVDQSRSKKTGGTGLGLAIVKHIVMAHDGKIELQSRQGKGTAVTVLLRAKD